MTTEELFREEAALLAFEATRGSLEDPRHPEGEVDEFDALQFGDGRPGEPAGHICGARG